MSQEANITFKPLKKQCDDDSTDNRSSDPIRDGENLPFTLSSRRLDIDIPSIRINAIECDFDESGGEFSETGTKFGSYNHKPHHQLALKDDEYLPKVLQDKFDFKSLACKPLEEVDPELKYQETFIAIGRDGKVHRLSAKKSSFIFDPFNRLRRIGIRISWDWQLPLLLRIALIFFCFSFVLPNYANNSVSTLVWNFTRYIFGGLLFAQICVNILARGFLVSKFTYLQSPWDWLDITTLIIIFLNLYWKNIFLHSLEGVVLFKFIPIVAGLKTGFQLTIQILKNLVPVLIYSLLTLWILVMVGLHIKNYNAIIQLQNVDITNNSNSTFNCELDNQYKNASLSSNETSRNYKLLPTIKPQTFLPAINQSQWNNISGSNSLLNTSLNNECLENYTLDSSPIINLSFQTTGIITFQAFGTVSTKQFTDPLLNHFLYVILTLIFGTFGVGLLTTASVGLAIFFFQPQTRGKNTQISSNSGHKSFTCLPNLDLPKCDIRAFVGFQRFLCHPFLELFITAVICLDIALMLVTYNFGSMEEGAWVGLEWTLKNGQDVCMLIYGIEFLLKLCFIPSVYLKSCWSILDFVVATVCVLNKVYTVPILIHFRVLKITSRWPTLQLLFYALVNSLWSRLSLICVLLLGWLCVRFATVNYIYGSNNTIPSNFLALVINQSFLITDWTTELEICQTGGGTIYLVCYVTWLLEVTFGIMFSSVIFVTVINSTCDMVSRPVDCCCENDNYINLKKAILLINGQFGKCCTSSSGESFVLPDSSINQIRVKEVPAHLHIPTSNGGPSSAHYNVGVSQYSPRDIDVNIGIDTNQVDVNQVDRKNPFVSSMLWGLRNLSLSSCASVGIIFSATAACILEFDSLQRTSPYYNPRFFIDLLFVCYFLLILLWKLVKNNFKSLKSPPWLLDFLIISASGFTIYTSILSKITIRVPVVRFITSLSYFRGLMLISRLEWLKVGLIAITYEVRLLWRYLAGILVVWMCLIWIKNNQEAFTNKLSSDYGSTGSANLTLVTALEKISIKTSLLLLHILLFGVFIGVIISELLRSELLSSFMTSAQLAIYKDKKLSFQREKTTHVPSPKRGLCVQITHYVTLTHAFDITVMATIICDCLVITFHHLATSKDWRIVWAYYPSFIIFMYASELSMKFVGWRSYYWKSGWNIFDTFVVAIGIIDILFFKIQLGFVTADTIRFLRILRIFQLQLFTRHAKLIHHTHLSLIRVFPCIANILFLYGLLLYTFTVVGLSLGISSDMNASTSRNILSSTQASEFRILRNFNNLLVSLLSLPFYGSVNSFQIAQADHCWWPEYTELFLSVYTYSFTVLSHALLGNVFVIVLHEILKTRSIRGSRAWPYFDTKGDVTVHSRHYTGEDDDVNENKYKHTNGGGFLNTDFASPDDPDSTATMLTPIEPLDDDPLGDDEKYPLRMSANGYILHVEAIVTSV